MKVRKILVIISLLLLSILLSACNEKKETAETVENSKTTNESAPIYHDITEIQKAITDSVTIMSIDEASNGDTDIQSDSTPNVSVKKVSFQAVDMAKVYRYLAANQGLTEIDEESLERFIKENQNNPDFISEYTIEAEMIQSDEAWVISSGSLEAVFNEQAEEILYDRISEYGKTIVAPTLSEEGD